MGVQRAADAVGPADRARQVGDVFGQWMLAANGACVDAVALAGLAHGIVAAVKVFALLEVLGEVLATVGQLAVEPEEPLLLRGERLPIIQNALSATKHFPDGECRVRCKKSMNAKLRKPESHQTYLDVNLLGLVRVHDCDRIQ